MSRRESRSQPAAQERRDSDNGIHLVAVVEDDQDGTDLPPATDRTSRTFEDVVGQAVSVELYEPDPALPWAERVLLRVEVGSTAHGTGLPGKEDYDELGVMAIPWEESIGAPVLGDEHHTIVYRPGRGPHDRSEAGDYD